MSEEIITPTETVTTTPVAEAPTVETSVVATEATPAAQVAA